MNVYMFLLNTKDKSEYSAVSSFNVYGKFLYAVTNNKNYYKEFIATRDMHKFTVETFEAETEEEYSRLLHECDIVDCELIESSFPTTTECDGYYTVGYVKVLCTVKESDEVEYDYDSYILDNIEDMACGIYDIMSKRFISLEICDAIMLYPKLFNQKIQDALEELEFSTFVDDCVYQIENVDSSEYMLNEDKLKVFCKKFSNTYKEGFEL